MRLLPFETALFLPRTGMRRRVKRRVFADDQERDEFGAASCHPVSSTAAIGSPS